MNDPTSITVALELLRSLGAPPRLLRHGETVADVAACLCAGLAQLGIKIDATFVAVGAALHDAGKIMHRAELDGPGREHEPAGEELLLRHGLSSRLAQVARTHGSDDGEGVSFEELLIIAADDLWKGTARNWVQRRVVAEVAAQLGVPQWQAFLSVDPIFEALSAGAAERLADAR